MLKLRVAIAQFLQEQNTFSPIKTKIEDFEQYGLYYRDEIIEKFSDANELSGFITELKKQKDIEIIPTIRAWAWPKGNVSEDTYCKLKSDLINLLKEALPLNGILISFHGAMVSDNTFDIEGDILETIHDVVSAKVPIVISCDLHANITKKMLKHAAFIEGYRTSPHVDQLRTGVKAATVLKKILNNNASLQKSFVKLPMITPARLHDSRKGPLKEIFNLIADIEKDPRVIGISLFPVQPWLDVPELGWSVLVYTESNKKFAEKYAKEIASRIWKIKDKFFTNELNPSQALMEARKMEEGLMVISDSDATSSGAPGDNTIILKEMITQNIDYPVLLSFIDREVVEEAIKIRAGNIIDVEIGGKMDNVFCKPVRIKANVKSIGESIFDVDGLSGKDTYEMGKHAVLEFGNITILVCEKNGPFYEPTVYLNAGLEPRDFRVVVVKSPVRFRDSYEKIADRIEMVEHPGFSSSNLNIFSFRHIPRPMYPFDNVINCG